jgi:HSP20 family protein
MLTTWNAFAPLDRLIDDVMRDVMGSAFGNAAGRQNFSPAIDVRANDQEVVFSLDVPGIKKEDLEVLLENGVLTIKGQRRYEYGENEKVWLGRSYGAFTRSFTLPDGLDVERMSAELNDGVLLLRLPKQPQAKPRRIEIAGTSEAKQLSDGESR